MKAPLVFFWLAIQAVSALCQMSLYSEISANVAEYDREYSTACAPDHQRNGICVGPLWKLIADQNLDFQGPPQPAQPIQFKTTSHPATFLVVVMPRTAGVPRYHVVLNRVDPPTPFSDTPFFRAGQGTGAFVISDHSATGVTQWRAEVTHRFPRHPAGYRVYVEEASVDHINQIHESSACSFESAWRAFNEQSHHHEVLRFAKAFVLMSVLLSVVIIGALARAYSQRIEGIGSSLFVSVVVVKFVLVDYAQQICVMLYLHGWYSRSGVRCQLCLFHPERCQEEHPFHFSNMMLIFCTVLACISNQLLFRPGKVNIGEDELVGIYFSRVGFFCLSILPTAFGIMIADSSLVSLTWFWHLLLTGPVVVGFVTIATLLCYPFLCLCEDEF